MRVVPHSVGVVCCHVEMIELMALVAVLGVLKSWDLQMHVLGVVGVDVVVSVADLQKNVVVGFEVVVVVVMVMAAVAMVEREMDVVHFVVVAELGSRLLLLSC